MYCNYAYRKSKKKKNKENSCPKAEAIASVTVQTQGDVKVATLSNKRKRKSPKSDSAKLAKLMTKKLNLSDTATASEKQKLAALFGDKVTSTQVRIFKKLFVNFNDKEMQDLTKISIMILNFIYAHAFFRTKKDLMQHQCCLRKQVEVQGI